MPRTVALAALVVLLQPSAATAADPLQGRQWGLSRVGAPQSWSASRGKGIVIAVVDSGVDLGHQDLRGRLVAGRDFVDGDARPQDRDGHGSHVAGIAAASAGNGAGVAGVAPRARIMPVRVLNEDGSGTAADVAAGIRWAADHGADVINLSLGDLAQPLFGPAFSEALDHAWSRGAIPVVAAGNEYLLSSGYADEPAIVVSATDRNDQKPGYSSGVGSARWGMAAPGGAGGTAPASDDILSTYWRRGSDGAYAYLAGTSMAAPHVSGAAAILRSLGLSQKQTVDRLLATARDVGADGRDQTFGYGRLDVAAAVDGLARPADPGAPPAAPAASPSAAPPAAAATPATTSPTERAPSAAPPGGPAGTQSQPEAEEGSDLPIAVFATGVVAVLVALLIAWALFRPNPPDD